MSARIPVKLDAPPTQQVLDGACNAACPAHQPDPRRAAPEHAAHKMRQAQDDVEQDLQDDLGRGLPPEPVLLDAMLPLPVEGVPHEQTLWCCAFAHGDIGGCGLGALGQTGAQKAAVLAGREPVPLVEADAVVRNKSGANQQIAGAVERPPLSCVLAAVVFAALDDRPRPGPRKARRASGGFVEEVCMGAADDVGAAYGLRAQQGREPARRHPAVVVGEGEEGAAAPCCRIQRPVAGAGDA